MNLNQQNRLNNSNNNNRSIKKRRSTNTNTNNKSNSNSYSNKKSNISSAIVMLVSISMLLSKVVPTSSFLFHNTHIHTRSHIHRQSYTHTHTHITSRAVSRAAFLTKLSLSNNSNSNKNNKSSLGSSINIGSCSSINIGSSNGIGQSTFHSHLFTTSRNKGTNTSTKLQVATSSSDEESTSTTEQPEQPVQTEQTKQPEQTVPTVEIPRSFQPFPFQYHEELILTVESLTNRGIGICRTTIDPSLSNHNNGGNSGNSGNSGGGKKKKSGGRGKWKKKQKQQEEDMALTFSTSTNIDINHKSTTTTSKNTNKNQDSNDSNDNNNNNTKSWVIMVPNVIPNEKIKLRIYRNYKNYSEADLIEIITPSPNRINNPPCPLSLTCGGCQYQHMDIETQRLWKKNHVLDLLHRIGNIDVEELSRGTSTSTCTGTDTSSGHDENGSIISDTIGTDEVYHYRSKITPHYDKPITNYNNINNIDIDIDPSKESKKIRAIGFKQKTNRNILDIPYCHIATEEINDKLQIVRSEKFKEADLGLLKRPKKGATLLLRDAFEYNEENSVSGSSGSSDGSDDVSSDGSDDDGSGDVRVVETDPNVYVKTKVKGLTFRFLAGNFFQNNPFMLPLMVDHVVDAAVAPNSAGDKMTHLIDCYCGSGLFCLSSASHFDVCVGIEVNEKAVEEATRNAEINNIENCKFVSASAEAIFMSEDEVDIILPLPPSSTNENENEKAQYKMTSILVRDFPKSTTTVVIDPPRKGCSTEFLDQLYQFNPQRVVYMSCDPATQARDAEGILGAGYCITSIKPFDLFPQTRHIENLIIFEKKS